ncbi:MAG TPA: site-2 protease family protein [Anaerolineae bacterium]|nr:site-2 protease family protein [Anaerolineae bacterium]
MKWNGGRVFWLVVVGLLAAYAIFQLGFARLVAISLSLLLAITVHECAHAWVADKLGDPTARYLGRVSLNPLVHLDPLGTMMMVMTAATGMGIGWGKPVPVSPHRLRFGRRLGNGIVALSGPMANLLLATVVGLIWRFVRPLPLWPTEIFAGVTMTNIVIAMFNLLPLPPLDGHSVLLALLSLSQARWAWQASQLMMRLAQQGGPLILILVILVAQFLGINLIGSLIGPPTRFLYRAIVGQ